MKRFFVRLHGRVSQAYNTFFPATLKKRTWWPVFLVGVLLIAVVAVVPAHAALVEDILNFAARTLASLLIELAKLCIFLTIFFLRAFITFASYNNFIDVSVVKLGWVMVRDVANMFFIVGLLVIAFATILGFESYEWKHGLVHIVLMAILINFSNLIAQLIIDVAHIFTITFLNAVSATAGGNLITLFQMDKVLALASGSPDALGQTKDVASLTLFAGAVLAFIFALLAALSIGAYLVVMIFRIVYLWALIVLSPLAFMLHAVPKGEDYAHEWWHEFNKQVIVAPIMVFFLWLAFATLGTGQIITEIQSGENVIQINSSGEQEQTVSILEISTWENFASFLLGIGFLWVGIKKTEETGAAGSHLVGGAIDWTKNVATIATGYAAGRWLVGKTAEHGSGLMHATGEYLSLGGSKVLDKTGIVGKAIRAPGRYLRDSAARRHEALHHRDKEEELKIKEAVSKFNAHPKGLLGKLTISHERLAEQEAATKLADREAHAAEGKYLAEASKNLAKSAEGRHRYEHLAEYEGKKTRAEKETKAIDVQVAAQLRLEDLKREEKEFNRIYRDLVTQKEQELGMVPLSEKDRANLREQAAKEVGGEIGLLYVENEAARPDNKLKIEEARVKANVVDYQRVQEGKKRKAVRINQMKEIQEDLEDYKDYAYDEHKEEFLNNFRTIRTAPQDSQEYKNAVQSQARNLESLLSKNLGKYVPDFLKSAAQSFNDHSFDNVNFNDPKNKHILDLASLSGKTLSDFEINGSYDVANDAVRQKQSAIQQKIIKDMSDKAGPLMRGLMVANDKAANEHNNIEAIHQVSFGKDNHGDEVIVYTNLMGQGTSAGVNPNTRVQDLYVTGAAGVNGTERRVGKSDYTMSTKNIDKIDAGSIGNGGPTQKFGVTPANPNGTKIQTVTGQMENVNLLQNFANDTIVELAQQIADKTATEIARLPKDLVNSLVGGQLDRSSFDNGVKKFVVANQQMAQKIGKIFERFQKNFEQAGGNQNTEDNIRKSLRNFLGLAGVRAENIEDLVDRIARRNNAQGQGLIRSEIFEGDGFLVT